MSMIRFASSLSVVLLLVMAHAGCSKAGGDGSGSESMNKPTGNAVPAAPDSKALDEQIAGIRGADAAGATALLKSLGFGQDATDLFSEDLPLKVTAAMRLETNLDADPEMESVVAISLQGQSEEEPTTLNRHVLVWLDPGNGRFNPVGFKEFSSDSCLMEGQFNYKAAKIRDVGISDIVVEWTDAPVCNGDFRQTAGTTIIMMKDGKLSDLMDYSDFNEMGRIEGDVIDPLISVHLSDSIPARATWKQEENGDVIYTAAFNLATNRFEVVPELTPEDARLDPAAEARMLGNNCFRHIKSGHFSRALGACSRLVESTAMRDQQVAGSTYYNMGLIAARTDDRESAAQWFRKSLEVRPGNKIVEAALAKIEGNDQ